MSFKFLRGEEYFTTLNLEPTQVLSLRPHRFIDNVEFCFQFNNEEPVVFATGPNECHITINPTVDGNMTFTDNDRTFKLFARERNND